MYLQGPRQVASTCDKVTTHTAHSYTQDLRQVVSILYNAEIKNMVIPWYVSLIPLSPVDWKFRNLTYCLVSNIEIIYTLCFDDINAWLEYLFVSICLFTITVRQENFVG